MTVLDSIPKEQPKMSEVIITSERLLTSQSLSSITIIVISCKILAEEMIKLQIVSPQYNNNEIDSDISVQVVISI